MAVDDNAEAIAPTRADRTTRGVGSWLELHKWSVATTAALIAIFARSGVPLDVTALLTFGIFVLLIDGVSTRGVSATVKTLRDWAPLVALLILYDRTRGLADSMGMPLQIDALVVVEEAMFFGELPTVWLQERLVGDQIAWWEAVLTLIYCSHFVTAPGLLLHLYRRDRPAWLGFARRFITLNLFGMLTYILVPAAPPWYASQHGHIDAPIGRVLSRGWEVIGLESAGGLMVDGQRNVNEVAALPSLHTGYSALVALFLWDRVRRARPLVAAYPVAMGFTLVYGGEHYVIDVLLGVVYALGVLALWRAIDSRRTSDVPDAPAPEGQAASEPSPLHS